MKQLSLHTEDHSIVRTFCGCFSDIEQLEEELHGACRPYAKPAVNIAETADSYMLEMTVPGYKRHDLQVKVEEDILIVSGDNGCVPEHYESVQHFFKKEFCLGAFSRSFLLPEDIDKVTACLKDGILFIYLTKGGLRRLPVEGQCHAANIPVK